MIHGNSQSNNDLATYGRVVIPIGRTPKRLDCNWLYELKVERLQTAAVEDGASPDGQTTGSVSDAAPASASSPAWANEGWSSRGGTDDVRNKKMK
ncbi:hypothetical protein ACVOMV_01670 [Mesorhizobium atlanticum]